MTARPLYLGFLLVACWSLLGCSEQGPRLRPLTGESKILAFGDSLTFGTGAQRGQSYPAVLAELTGLSVINAGIPGELSEAGVSRLPAMLDSHAPSLLILCHGGNDFLRKKNLTAAENNLKTMIEMAQERDVQVLLLGVPRPGLWLSTDELYARVAAESAVPLEDQALAEILGSAALKSDPVHPNAQGYRALAQAIADKLSDLGAL